MIKVIIFDYYGVISQDAFWYEVKGQELVRNYGIAEQLIATGDEELVEGNSWGDRYWGVDPVGSRNGRNKLGEVLTIVRKDLKSSRANVQTFTD